MFVFVAAVLLAGSGTFLSSSPLTPVSTAFSADEMPTGDALKCSSGRSGGDPDMREAVLIVDGEALPGELEELDPATVGSYDLSSYELVCWQWIETYHGVQVRYAGYVAYTRGYVERIRTNGTRALEAVIAAQDRHMDDHGAYAGGVEELPDLGLSDYGLPGFFELTLERTNGGWSARVGPTAGWLAEFERRGSRYGPLDTCRAFSGSAPEQLESAVGEGEPAPRERQPFCSRSRAVGSSRWR